MRLTSCLIALFVALAGTSPAEEQPVWTVNAGAIFLTRDSLHPAVIVNNPFSGQPALNARDLVFSEVTGPDISISRLITQGVALEIRYFGVDAFQATGGGRIPSFFEAPGFDFSTTDSSDLFSVEANFRGAADDSQVVDWLVGFRWLNVNERLETTFAVPANEIFAHYSTLNQLWGAQLGADCHLLSAGPVNIDCLLKAGLFGNAATSEMFAIHRIGAQPHAADEQTQTAFAGEIGLTASWQVTNHIVVRGGYQWLWLDGIAVAADQPSAVNQASHNGIDTTGGIFYHGALASMLVTW